MPKLGISLRLQTTVMQVARLARDLWNSVSLNDPWELELRKWEDIV